MILTRLAQVATIVSALVVLYRFLEETDRLPRRLKLPKALPWKTVVASLLTVVVLVLLWGLAGLEREIGTLRAAALPCPPNSPTFFGSEIIAMPSGTAKEVWRLTESIYRPPGSTGARGAHIRVAGEGGGSILWSNDGSKPSQKAEVGDELWACGDQIPRFQVSLRSLKSSALHVTYAW